MGLSGYPSSADGLLPLLVMNTVMSVAFVKNIVRSAFQVVGAGGQDTGMEEYSGGGSGGSRGRKVSITRYGSLCRSRIKGIAGDRGGSTAVADGEWPGMDDRCCVCLCVFEDDEEVSELYCEHFFHKGCLDKWFENEHDSCPLCRSMM